MEPPNWLFVVTERNFMMKIAYFSNQFSSRQGHGVARYAHELYEAVEALDGDTEITPVAAWSDRDDEDLGKLQRRTGLQILPWGRKLTPLFWNYLGFPRIESWLDKPADIVHAVSLGYPVATKKPYVVTVHDIGPLTHPEYFSEAPPWIMERSLKQAVKQAAALVCVSQATADEVKDYVRKHYSVDIGSRVHVVLEGVGEEFFQQPDMTCLDSLENLPGADVPFILSAGKISPRKNFQGVIEALGKIKDCVPHHLVAVGGDGWDFAQVKDRVREYGIQDRVHFVGYVSDEQLRALYRRASVYVHASLFEGFGLTVLEAMASGCPVVTSNCSSLPEVAGDAALLVDPHNSDEIAAALVSVCGDFKLADLLKSKGISRAQTFSWKKCAVGVQALYESVLADSTLKRSRGLG